MEYFVVIGGQKQGPYDMLSIIKKIKNGTITAETLVAAEGSTAFRPATDFEEIKALLKQEKSDMQKSDRVINFSLKEVLTEGVDLWSRKVIEYTVGAGLVLAISFGAMFGLKQIQALADFPTAISYIVSVVTTILFSMFFYYVLISRRNQEPDITDVVKTGKKSFLRLFVFSVIFSLYILPFELGEVAKFISLAIFSFVACFMVFVPFLVQDSDLTLKDALRVSVDRTRTIGADNFSVVFALVAINLACVIIPEIFSANLSAFGLFISIPITVAGLVYMYDQLFA